jgi:cell division protease FtsH
MATRSAAATKLLQLAKAVALHQRSSEMDEGHVLVALVLYPGDLIRAILGLPEVRLPEATRTRVAERGAIEALDPTAAPVVPFASSLFRLIGLNSEELGSLLAHGGATEAGPEHLAASLLCSAAPIVDELRKLNGLSADQARARALLHLAPSPGAVPGPPPAARGTSTAPGQPTARPAGATTTQSLSDLVGNAKSLADRMKTTVLGQDHAVDIVVTSILQSAMSRTDGKPLSFLFAGDSGTGKTFLANQLAAALRELDGRWHVLVLNMSRYVDPQVAGFLNGGDAMFRNSRPGDLTGPVAEHPRTVVVLDEFDRADPQAFGVLLDVLGTGQTKDNHTQKTVSFTDTIFILTTNAGRDLYLDDKTFGFFRDARDLPRSLLVDALRRELPPAAHAFIDRVRHPVLFNRHTFPTLTQLCRKNIEEWGGGLTRYGVRVDWPPQHEMQALITLLLLSGRGGSSARSLPGIVEKHLQQPVQAWLMSHTDQVPGLKGLRLHADVDTTADASSPAPAVVLAIDDDERELDRIAAALGDSCEVLKAATPGATESFIDRRAPGIDLVLLDLLLTPAAVAPPSGDETFRVGPEFEAGLALLHLLRTKHPDIPVYIRSAYVTTPDDALYDAAMRVGGAAGSFEKKPLSDPAERTAFAAEVASIVENRRWERRIRALERRGERFEFSVLPSFDPDQGVLHLFIEDAHLAQTPMLEDFAWFSVEVPNVRFEDLVGVDAARSRLDEAIRYLEDPAKFKRFGVKPPTGFLLYGVPGTGKTSLAKALANAARTPFIAASASAFSRKYVGEGPEQIRRLFAAARRYAPVVLFVDEIDALGSRQTIRADESIEQTRLITTFLECMDGFDSGAGIIVLAATNDPDALDPALVRPGRLSRRIELVPPETPEERRRLLDKLLSGKSLADGHAIVQQLVRSTVGMTPAEITDIVNEAILSMARRGAEAAELRDFLEARNLIALGERSGREMSPGVAQIVAYHEAGHAVMQHVHGQPSLQVTIEPRRGPDGGFAGLVEGERNDGIQLRTRPELEERIDVCLAGRAAEELMGYPPSDGAGSDVATATRLAVAMLGSLAMYPDIQLAAFDRLAVEDAVKLPALWKAVNDLLAERRTHVAKVLREHREALVRLSEVLLREKTLTGEEAASILKGS